MGQRASLFTVLYKLRVSLFQHNPLPVQVSPGPLFSHLVGTRGQGNLQMMIFWSLILMSNKLPSVSDPGSSLMWKALVLVEFYMKFTLKHLF